MKTLLLALSTMAVAALPVIAQHPAPHQADPDKKVAGGGIHFMSGPAGIYCKAADKATGASNTLAVEVGKDKVRFLVNGTEVNAADASAVDAAGIAGLRINHNLNVHVEAFAVKSR